MDMSGAIRTSFRREMYLYGGTCFEVTVAGNLSEKEGSQGLTSRSTDVELLTSADALGRRALELEACNSCSSIEQTLHNRTVCREKSKEEAQVWNLCEW